MNNNYVKFAIVGIACAAFCAATFAAPRGGAANRPPARENRAPARPAAKPPTAKPAHAPQVARPAARPPAAKPARAPQVARPAAKPPAAKPVRTPQVARPGGKAPSPNLAAGTARPPAVAKHGHVRPEPHHHAPPRHFRHHIPSHARYCTRTPVPAWRFGARWAWEWIEEEWLIIVNGVYYYGDGYYYDGYNYYYNGAYHTVPPVPMHA